MQTITQRAESDWILPAGSTSFQTYETSEEHILPLQNVVSSIDLHAGIFFPISYEALVICLSLVKG